MENYRKTKIRKLQILLTHIADKDFVFIPKYRFSFRKLKISFCKLQ